MRSTRFTLAVAATFFLAGCAEAGPLFEGEVEPIRSTAESTTMDDRLTDVAALDAAVDAYLNYIEATSQVLSDGHDNDGRLDEVTSGELREGNVEVIETARLENWSVSGEPTIRDSQLVSLTALGENTEIVADICSDQSTLDSFHEDGTPALDPEKNLVLPIRITALVSADESTLSSLRPHEADLEC